MNYAPRARYDIARPRDARAVRLKLQIAQLSADLGAIVAAFAVPQLGYGHALHPYQIILVLMIFAGGALDNGAYDVAALEHRAVGQRRALRALALTLVVMTVIMFALKANARFSRVAFTLGGVLGTCLIPISRHAFQHMFREPIRRGLSNVVVLVDGDEPAPFGPMTGLIQTAHMFDPDSDDPQQHMRLGHALAGADRVVVHCAPARRASWTRMLRASGIQVEIVAEELADWQPQALASWGGTPTMVVSVTPLSLVDVAMKRAFDLGVSLFALVLLSPLLIGVAREPARG